MIGTKLAHYEITAHLGSGGMGDVYQATDTKLGRSVAIKFLPEVFSHDSERAARLAGSPRAGIAESLEHRRDLWRRRNRQPPLSCYGTGFGRNAGGPDQARRDSYGRSPAHCKADRGSIGRSARSGRAPVSSIECSNSVRNTWIKVPSSTKTNTPNCRSFT